MGINGATDIIHLKSFQRFEGSDVPDFLKEGVQTDTTIKVDKKTGALLA